MAESTRSQDLKRELTAMIVESERRQESRMDSRMQELMVEMARMQEMMLELKHSVHSINKGKEKVGEGSSESGNLPRTEEQQWGSATRLEFPRFEGEGIDGWLLRAEYFFQVVRIAAENRVKIAALHLEGRALQWHQGFVKLRGADVYEDWDGYVRALESRFGVLAFEDPIAELRNLKQPESLTEYLNAFDAIYPKAGITEEQALSFFLSGLCDELQMTVRMFKPRTLIDAYSLTKLQELAVAALQNKPKISKPSPSPSPPYHRPLSITTNSNSPKPTHSPKPISPSYSTNRPTNRPPRSFLTSKEMDDKRAKNLCYWCDDKYTPGHRCKNRQIYVLQVKEVIKEEELEVLGREIEEEEAAVEGQLSLNALWGTGSNQTMMLKGVCGKVRMHILIDTGSTHNFISEQTARKIGCETKKVVGLWVEIANGQEMRCNYLCSELRWEMQHQTFQAEVYTLPLASFDLILGIQWLKTLGNVMWNFKELTMTFKVGNRDYHLKGEPIANSSQQLQMLQFKEEGSFKYFNDKKEAQIFHMTDISSPCSEVLALLPEFQDIFQDPEGLPPSRELDHRIPLLEGSSPPNIRPYRQAGGDVT